MVLITSHEKSSVLRATERGLFSAHACMPLKCLIMFVGRQISSTQLQMLTFSARISDSFTNSK